MRLISSLKLCFIQRVIEKIQWSTAKFDRGARLIELLGIGGVMRSARWSHSSEYGTFCLFIKWFIHFSFKHNLETENFLKSNIHDDIIEDNLTEEPSSMEYLKTNLLLLQVILMNPEKDLRCVFVGAEEKRCEWNSKIKNRRRSYAHWSCK